MPGQHVGPSSAGCQVAARRGADLDLEGCGCVEDVDGGAWGALEEGSVSFPEPSDLVGTKRELGAGIDAEI